MYRADTIAWTIQVPEGFSAREEVVDENVSNALQWQHGFIKGGEVVA